MPLPTLADRAWYAYHCLPRDRGGQLPTFKELELAEGLSYSTLSHVMSGRRSQHRHETYPKLARALRVSEAWLRGDEGARGPTLTGPWPPRPGTRYIRYGDVPGWPESVALALLEPNPIVLRCAFLAGADMPVLRPIDRITPEIALHVSGLAYATLPREMQKKYSSLESQGASPGGPVVKPRLLRKA